jgi:hypothetical protein
MQQALSRYYGNATGCTDHVTKENLICHNIYICVCVCVCVCVYILADLVQSFNCISDSFLVTTLDVGAK